VLDEMSLNLIGRMFMNWIWQNTLHDRSRHSKLFVTPREAADLRAILARLTENKISLSFHITGDLSNPEGLSIEELVKDRAKFSFNFEATSITRTIFYEDSGLSHNDSEVLSDG
jgi:hypothetical protein